MKHEFKAAIRRGCILIVLFIICTPLLQLNAQIPPPGFEREMKMRAAQPTVSSLDRDSVTLVDTIVVFDPQTYEETTMINISKYSIRDYCKSLLGMNDPDILLDRKEHTITDPKTYEDMVIRLNAAGKIDTIPK